MVGSLMYTVIGTRLDIAFTVTRLSQFLTIPTKNHFGAIKHVFRYLKGTRDIKLSFPYLKGTRDIKLSFPYSRQQQYNASNAHASDALIFFLKKKKKKKKITKIL